METIIGRKDEINKLKALARSQRAEFAALYGRRRVGKTFLVNEVFKHDFTFKMTGVLEGSRDDQFRAFADAMDDCGLAMDKRPDDWMEAFIALKKALKDVVKQPRRCVLFIDELPALDAGNSNVAGALGYFWNSWAAQQDNILLIICGSATSWMIGNVIDSKGGLHDRITCEMAIHPFTIAEVEAYLQSKNVLWNRLMILQTYMIFGGIPYYLSLLEPGESLVQNIDRLFFGRDMQLRREFKRLFNTLYRNPDRNIDLVKALSAHRRGMTRNELAEALNVSNNGHLGNRLDDLVNCDLVSANVVREKKIKRKDVIYQLCDFFSLFYLTFVDRANVERQYWSHHINTPEVNVWMGLAFERVCMAHVEQIKRALRIDGISTMCYAWRSRQTTPAAQIDMVIERADHIVNICEVKYSQGLYALTREEYDKLLHRRDAFVAETGLRHTAWITLITTGGTAPGQYADMVPRQLTLDDLF